VPARFIKAPITDLADGRAIVRLLAHGDDLRRRNLRSLRRHLHTLRSQGNFQLKMIQNSGCKSTLPRAHSHRASAIGSNCLWARREDQPDG